MVYILKNVLGSSILWKCHLFLYTVDKYCCRKKNHIRRDTSIISRKWSIVLYIHVHVFECLHQRRVQKYHLGTCILLKYACANVTVLTWHCLNKYSLLNDVRFNDQVSITYACDIFHFYRTFRMNNNNMWWILLVLPIMGFVIGVFFFYKWRYKVRRRTGMY